MIVLGNFLIAVAQIFGIILTILYWLILIRALISWVNPDPFNPVVQFLHRSTEPILIPIRQRMPRMAVDLSPIIAFLIIIFLKSFLVMSLMDMGARMKYNSQSQRPLMQMQVQEEAPRGDVLPADQLFN